MEQILNCPFCGATEIEICRTNENACWIRCADCGGESESAPTREQAIKNWNRRDYSATLASIVEDGDAE